MLGAGEVNAHMNTLKNNEFGLYVSNTNNNKVRHNSLEITSESVDLNYWGILVSGDNNLISQNSLMSTDAGYVGIYILSGIQNKLIRNSLSGWDYDVYDVATQTIWPEPFQ